MNPNNLTPYTWADLAQKLGLRTSQPRSPGNSVRTTRNTVSSTSLDELMQRQCVDGERTAHLTTLIGTLLATRKPSAEALQQCHTWNKQNTEPLDDDKINSTFRSILASDQRNHPERYPELRVHKPLFELSAGRIDRYLATAPTDRRWLLKNMIVLGKVGAIVAPGGSSKSQWLLQLAVGVASGVPVAEHWEIGETGGVLVFFAEDDEDEIHRRLKRITDQFMLAGHAAQYAGINERLYIYTPPSAPTRFSPSATPQARCPPQPSWIAWLTWPSRSTT